MDAPHGWIWVPPRSGHDRLTCVVQVRPVGERIGVDLVLAGDGKHSSIDSSRIVELPVAIVLVRSVNVPAQNVSVGMQVGGLVVVRHGSTPWSVVRRLRCVVGADVDLSEDGLHGGLVVRPLLVSNGLVALLGEAVVHVVGSSESIGGSSETNERNLYSLSGVVDQLVTRMLVAGWFTVRDQERPLRSRFVNNSSGRPHIKTVSHGRLGIRRTFCLGQISDEVCSDSSIPVDDGNCVFEIGDRRESHGSQLGFRIGREVGLNLVGQIVHEGREFGGGNTR